MLFFFLVCFHLLLWVFDGQKLQVLKVNNCFYKSCPQINVLLFSKLVQLEIEAKKSKDGVRVKIVWVKDSYGIKISHRVVGRYRLDRISGNLPVHSPAQSKANVRTICLRPCSDKFWNISKDGHFQLFWGICCNVWLILSSWELFSDLSYLIGISLVATYVCCLSAYHSASPRRLWLSSLYPPSRHLSTAIAPLASAS